MRGIEVTVVRYADGGTDRLGNPIEGAPTYEEVDDVLIAPSGAADMEASRPEGVTVSMTLHFPKTYTGDLRGCDIELPSPYDVGNPYRVIGDPHPYMDANTPTRWNRPVEVARADG